MLAAIENVEHGHGQRACAYAAQIAIEREPHGLGRCLGNGQAHAQNSVGAQIALIGRAIQLNQIFIDQRLFQRIHAHQFIGNGLVHVFHSLQNTLTTKPFFVIAIAQFNGFVHACTGATGYNGAAHGAAF